MSPVTLRGIALLAVSTVVVVGGFLLWPFGPEISDEDYKIAVPASEIVNLPQLLLPDASKQMQYRRRIVDPVTQIAHDEILLKSGFTQVVTVFNTANGACLNELTYYPVAREQDYSEEAKKAQSAPVVAVQPLDMHPAPHGPLYRERTCSVSGLGTASEVIYDRNGKVTSKSELFAEGLSRYHYKTEIFNVLGKVATSQLRNLQGGLVEQTEYNLAGVRTSLRKSPTATLNSWDAFQYQPDGVTLRVQESRSYGNYSVIYYHPDGKTIAERSAVTTSGATLDTYRADGKQIKSIDKRKWGCDVVITDYGVNGLPILERHLDTYCIKDSKTYNLADVTVHDGDGVPIRKYVFDRKQQLASVEIRLPATEADKGIRPEGYRKPLKDDKPADVWVVYNLRDIVLDSKQVVINKVKSDLMKPDADIGRAGDLNAAGRKALVMLDKAWFSQAELAPVEAEKVDVSAERQTHPY